MLARHDAGGCGPFSGQVAVSVSTIPSAPGAPTFTTTYHGPTKPTVLVKWEAQSSATRYELIEDSTLVYNNAGLSYSSLQQPGVTLTYKVRAWLTALLLLIALLCAGMGTAHAAETITYYYTSPQGTVLAKADAGGSTSVPILGDGANIAAAVQDPSLVNIAAATIGILPAVAPQLPDCSD